MVECQNCGFEYDITQKRCPKCGSLNPHIVQLDNPETSQIFGFIFLLIICSIIALFSNTMGYINEFSNYKDYQNQVWCGYYDADKIRIYAPDMKKNGSTICLEKNSWRDDAYVRVQFNKQTDYKKFGDNIVIVEGKYDTNEYGNKIIIADSISIYK